MIFRPALTLSEYLDVGKMLYEQYLWADLIPPNEHEIYISPYMALPTSYTVYATHQDRLIYTATIAGDSPYGLPSDASFPGILDGYRNGYTRICEIICLAGRTKIFCQVHEFCKFLAVIARLRYDILILCCHPRHSVYYRKYWNAEQIAEEKSIERANGHPGVLLEIQAREIPSDLDVALDYDFWKTASSRDPSVLESLRPFVISRD